MSLRLFVPCTGQVVHPYAQCRPQAIFQSVALSSTPTAVASTPVNLLQQILKRALC